MTSAAADEPDGAALPGGEDGPQLRVTTIADLVIGVVRDASRPALEKGVRWLGEAVRS